MVAHIQDWAEASAGGVTAAAGLQSSAAGSSPVTGNTIIVGIAAWAGSAVTISQVQDTAGNSYTQDASIAYSNTSPTRAVLAVWRSSGITGGSNFKITVKPSITTGITFFAFEVSGLVTVSPLDGAGSTNSGQATGTAFSTGAFSTTNANDLLVAMIGFDSTQGSLSAPSGFTPSGTELSGAVEGGQLNWKIVSTTQSSINPTANGNVVSQFAGIGLAYKATSGGLFRPWLPSGLGTGGPFFQNPLG